MLWSCAPTSIYGRIRPLIGPNEGLWRARDGVRPCPVARGSAVNGRHNRPAAQAGSAAQEERLDEPAFWRFAYLARCS